MKNYNQSKKDLRGKGVNALYATILLSPPHYRYYKSVGLKKFNLKTFYYYTGEQWRYARKHLFIHRLLETMPFLRARW